MIDSFFRRLRDAIWPAKAARATPPRQLVIYDDMFEDYEIMPASAAAWCTQQFGEIDTFAAKHEAPDGAGWTDIYMRPQAPATIKDLAIPYEPAVELLAQRLPEFDEAIAHGYDDPGLQRIRGRAFGTSLAAVIVYPDDAARTVRTIAVTLRGESAELAEVLAALAAIGSREPLMVVNWAASHWARLDRADEVAAYLVAPR
jgi:hypothetical protein